MARSERRGRGRGRWSGLRPARGRARRSGDRSASRERTTNRRRIAALSALTVLSLAYVVFFTPFLGVGSVEVVGAASVGADRVREVAAVPRDHPLIRVDTDGVAEKVAALPGVAAVEVSRSWPSTLTIAVTERRAVAYHDSGSELALVDVGGVLFQEVDEEPDALARLEVFDPGPADARTRASVAVLAALPRGLAERIVAVRADTPGSVEFELTEGERVRWGDARQNREKARVLEVLLTRDGETYDVSSPELPTVS